MKNELSSNNLAPIPFPKVRRTISLILAYLGVVLVIALFFSPILGIKETEEIGGEKFTIRAACSPYQLITKDTHVNVRVSGGTESENDFVELMYGEIDVADGATDGVIFFNLLYEEGNAASTILATVLLIIMYVPLTVCLVLTFSGKLTSKPKRLKDETDEAYKKRVLRLAGNEELIRFAHLRIPQVLIAIVGFPIMMTIILCALSFSINYDDASDIFSIFSIYRNNVDFLLIFSTFIILIGSFSLTGGVGLGKINKLLINNYVCDYDNQVFRPRTPEETEQIFAKVGLSSVTNTTYTNRSQTTNANIAKESEPQTSKDMSEEARIKLLKEYKYLLDEGVISKEEYETKKKELLSSSHKNNSN